MDFKNTDTDAPNNVLFENTYARTTQMLRETQNAFALRTHIGLIVVIDAVTILLNFLTGWSYFPLLCATLVLIVGLPILLMALYSSNVKKISAQERERCGGQTAVFVATITEASVTFRLSWDEQLLFNCTDIRAVKHTPNYLFLIMSNNLAYPLAKDGFTVGTYQEFCNFLQSKNIKI